MAKLNPIPETLKLNELAEVLNVHPRTVLRHVKGDMGAYWAKGYNPDICVDDLVLSMGANLPALIRALEGKDELLTPRQASEYLIVPHRTFSFRKYKAAVRIGKTVRYSSIDIANEHIDKHLKM